MQLEIQQIPTTYKFRVNGAFIAWFYAGKWQAEHEKSGCRVSADGYALQDAWPKIIAAFTTACEEIARGLQSVS